MKKVALLFPGQGAQYVGMGQNLEPEYQNYFKQADGVLEFSLSSLVKDGPEEKLQLTEFTQPAIVTHSYAIFKKVENFLKDKDAEIAYALGHSVGEYAALAACGAIDFLDAVKAVNLRGRFMQEAVPAGVGKMFAIVRTTSDNAKAMCDAVSTDESFVAPANYNAPEQTVISGHAGACEAAIKHGTENMGLKFRAIELKVSAPFHSKLMAPAAANLEKAFASFTFHQPKFPYIANIDAKLYDNNTNPETIKDNLIKQVTGSVRWVESIKQLPSDTICIECGPGKVLAGLVSKINPDLKVVSMDFEGSFSKLEELLKE